MNKLTKAEEKYYAELEAKFSDPNTVLKAFPGQVLTGEAAAAEGRAFLLKEYGSEEALEAVIHPGRPQKSTARVSTKIASYRLDATTQKMLAELAKQTGNNQSEALRKLIRSAYEQQAKVA